MDPDYVDIVDAAMQAGITVERRADGRWTVMAAPDAALGLSTDTYDSLTAGNVIVLSDGRAFPRVMTDAELRAALALPPAGGSAS
jgi:hypothetical protein